MIIHLISYPAILELANQNLKFYFIETDELVYKMAFVTQFQMITTIGLISFIRSFTKVDVLVIFGKVFSKFVS